MRKVLRLTLGMLAAFAMLAPAAQATFPGRNGRLAVVPVNQLGVQLVDPRTSATQLVCPDQRGYPCVPSSVPSWSPDGRQLAFSFFEANGLEDFYGTGLDILASDGACQACDPVKLSTDSLAVTAFMADGDLSISVPHGLLALPANGETTSPNARHLDVPDAATADWSATGQLAIARNKSVWAGRPGHLRKIASGVAPSWSPTGRQLAFDSNGWVWIIRPGGRPQRLVRGYGPAWAPNGKSIAFFGHDRDLEIIPSAGGSVRRVGSVRGYSADWQPLPSH